MERFFHVGLNVEVKDKLNVKNGERVDSDETRLPFLSGFLKFQLKLPLSLDASNAPTHVYFALFILGFKLLNVCILNNTQIVIAL